MSGHRSFQFFFVLRLFIVLNKIQLRRANTNTLLEEERTINVGEIMFAVAGRTAATRAVAPLARSRAGQRRNMGMVDWMVNYPDKVRA